MDAQMEMEMGQASLEAARELTIYHQLSSLHTGHDLLKPHFQGKYCSTSNSQKWHWTSVAVEGRGPCCGTQKWLQVHGAMSPEFPPLCLFVTVGWLLSITNPPFSNLTNGSNRACPTAPKCTGLQSKEEGVGWEHGHALARPS